MSRAVQPFHFAGNGKIVAGECLTPSRQDAEGENAIPGFLCGLAALRELAFISSITSILANGRMKFYLLLNYCGRLFIVVRFVPS